MGVQVTVRSSSRPRDAASRTPGQLARSLRAHHGDVLVIPGRGLRFSSQLSFERWLSVGRQLSDIYSSSAWCLGDWLAYGQAAYDGRYRDAIEQTSLDYQTLRNYAWVVRQFSLSRRRDSLSFGHHAEVAALPEVEQDFWLRKAEELGWPVKRLRHEVRRSLSERSVSDDSSRRGASHGELPGRDESSNVMLQIHLTSEQMQACQAAADRAHLTMQEWAVVVLGEAARHELGSRLPHSHWRGSAAFRDVITRVHCVLLSVTRRTRSIWPYWYVPALPGSGCPSFAVLLRQDQWRKGPLLKSSAHHGARGYWLKDITSKLGPEGPRLPVILPADFLLAQHEREISFSLA
jgi:hypothetical protein